MNNLEKKDLNKMTIANKLPITNERKNFLVSEVRRITLKLEYVPKEKYR